MPPSNGDQDNREKKSHDSFEITGLVVQIITLVILGIYTSINYCLYETTSNTEQAAYRSALYLGWKNGKVADFVSSAADWHLLLFVYNYGGSTAEDSIIEAWPIVARDKSTTSQCIPPFQGFRHRMGAAYISGVEIPPKF